MRNEYEKQEFLQHLKEFASTLGYFISKDDEWTIRGFIDVFKNIYSISTDTKVVSKIIELHLFPHFVSFADKYGYRLELASYQNWYPDLTFVGTLDESIKFAVDLKTSYRLPNNPDYCNGFTLGSHGDYFVNRDSSKNIQHPYNEYSGHFCLGIIYTRAETDKDNETQIYSIDTLELIPAVIKNFTFFAEEKWKIASDKAGSGNTANIGSINKIDDILRGNGVFSKAGEEYFDNYWTNYGKIMTSDKNGASKPIRSFIDYLAFRGLSEELNNPKARKRRQ